MIHLQPDTQSAAGIQEGNLELLFWEELGKVETAKIGPILIAHPRFKPAGVTTNILSRPPSAMQIASHLTQEQKEQCLTQEQKDQVPSHGN